MRSLLVALLVCAAAPALAVRPTDGDGWFGNGYDAGVPVFSFDSPAGHFRVFYVEESLDAVQVGDADADGVPDFVELVAQHADETWASAIDERGFRPPLDDSIYNDSDDFGGDSRYDVYLADISDSDGYRVVEACTASPLHCAGYFVMENDFAGFGYPSDDFAIKILTSHELFHSLQDAYDADQDGKWTEGTAVWNTEQVFPETDDLERFLPYFLDRPDRPFDRTGGAIADLYPYGAAIWAVYLSERFGPDTILRLWEACEDAGGEDPDFLEATDAYLAAEHGSSIEDAWLEFTRWNLFTDARADPSRSYAGGAAYPSVFLEPMIDADATYSVEGMSARYVPFELGPGPARVTVSVADDDPAVEAILYADGEEVPFVEETSRTLHADLPDGADGAAQDFVVITSVIRGSRPRDVAVSFGPIPDPPDAGVDPVDGDGGGCGCRAGGAASGGAASGGAPFILLTLGAWARRRSRRRRAP